MVVLHLVDADDPGLQSALSGAGLPAPGDGRYFHAVIRQTTVGHVGLEGQGADLLLRSLVATPDQRSRGQGGRLLAAVEAAARDLGATRLHLLTTTAAPFFIRHGFVAADRETAPETVRFTDEFADLCPASAAYLTKDL